MATKTKERPAPVEDGQDTELSPITLTRIERAKVVIPIQGITPVIPHRFSEKARAMLRDAQMGSRLRAPREPKDPEAEAEAALYRLPDGRPGMPATAFRAACVEACQFYRGIFKKHAKCALFVIGEGEEQLVPLRGTLRLREDTPRNATGVVDLRYRYEVADWSADITIVYVTSVIDAMSVMWLLDAAGAVGVGDWRPSSPKSHTGIYGQWKVATTEVPTPQPVR
jgi:hypothetical protein